VGACIGAEASKWKVANYFGKLEQMIMVGSGASYSQGFPILPEGIATKRRCPIHWSYWVDAIPVFKYELATGHWK
jgi:hypothetical protein